MNQALPSFLDELEKIAMARVGLDPGKHVALRLMERVPGLSRREALEAERRLLQALQKPGGVTKYLGRGDFSLPVRLGDNLLGTAVMDDLGPTRGHVLRTFLGPNMSVRPSTRPISRSSLSRDEHKVLKKEMRSVKKLLRGAGKPKASRDLSLPAGRRIFR